MTKYVNRFTGVVAEPACEVAEQSFANAPEWTVYKEPKRKKATDKEPEIPEESGEER